MKKKIIILCILSAVLVGELALRHINESNDSSGTSSTQSSNSSSTTEESDEHEYDYTINNSTSSTTSINASMGDNIIIKDESFVTQLDEIFGDIDSYVGKTITVEGKVQHDEDGEGFLILRLYEVAHEDHSHQYDVGISAKYSGELPKEDSWVRVTGKIEKAYIVDRDEPVVNVETIEVLDTEGQYNVTN